MEGWMLMSYVDDVLTRVANQNPDQPEFNQAVTARQSSKMKSAIGRKRCLNV